MSEDNDYFHESKTTPHEGDLDMVAVEIDDELDQAGEGPPAPEATHVVGVGASAGGLESLERLFAALPDNSGLCLLLVQHLSPRHRSLMGELLEKHTRMQVLDARQGAPLLPNTVYVMQPKSNLEVRNRRLYLTDRDPETPLPNFAVDLLFRSLAVEFGEDSIGIVLSGTGSDGTGGFAAIKQAGGWTLAEEPGSARFSAMPQSAIESGVVDTIAPAEDIATELMSRSTRVQDESRLACPDLPHVFKLLRQQQRIDFTHYKPATVIRRLERRRQATGCATADDYADLLRASQAEVDALAAELLIGVTRFFRDPDARPALELALRELLIQRESEGSDTVRFWVAGCSTGEEAYSLAMLVDRIASTLPTPVTIKIFATDISGPAIDTAARGEYPASIAHDIDAELLTRYMSPSRSGGYVIDKTIRKMIVFTRHDVLQDPPFTRVDFVSCRNLLIYLTPTAQGSVLSRFEFALRPDGLLFLGCSESLGDSELAFKAKDKVNKIFRRLTDSTTRPLAMLDVRQDRSPPRPAPHEPQRVEQPTRQRPEANADRLEALLDVLQPACLVVARDGQVLYAFGGATEFLRMAPGRLGLDMSAVLPDELAIVISAALDRVWNGERALLIQNAKFCAGGQRYEGRIRVARLGRLLGSSLGAVVSFEDLACVPSDAHTPIVELEEAAKYRLCQLEHELQRTRDTLQATVEELEASNEELQSTNEELVSSNEELQSTNEELQSLNEELHTVNAELQAKVIELSDLTDDLDNVLENVDAGVLLVDTSGKIRRFNRPATYAFNLLKEDKGRPIAYINHRFSQLDLQREFTDVFESLVGVERKLLSSEGRCYIVRIHPMRTREGEFDGVLLTTSDITALTEIHDRLNLFAAVSEQAPSAQLLTNNNGVIQYVNSARAAQLDDAPERIVGRDVRTLFAAKNAEQTTQALLSSIEAGTPWSGQLWISRSCGSPCLEDVQMYPLRDPAGHVRHAVLVSEKLHQGASDNLPS